MTKQHEDHPIDRPEYLLDYLDGALEAEERARLEAHLEGCPQCRTEVVRQRSVHGLLANYRLVEPPADLPAAIFASLQAETAEREGESRPVTPEPAARRGGVLDWLERHRLRPQVLVPLAAAFLLVAVGVGSVSSELLEGERETAEDTFSTAAEEAAPQATLDAERSAAEKELGQEDADSAAGAEEPAAEPRADAPATDQAEADIGDGSSGTVFQEAPEAGSPTDTPAVAAAPGQAVNLRYGSPAETLSADLRPAGLFSAAESVVETDTMPAAIPGDSALSYLLWFDPPQVEALLAHTWSLGFHPEISVIDLVDLPADMRLQAERTGVYEVDDSGLLRRQAGSGTIDEHVAAGRVLVMIRLPLP